MFCFVEIGVGEANSLRQRLSCLLECTSRHVAELWKRWTQQVLRTLGRVHTRVEVLERKRSRRYARAADVPAIARALDEGWRTLSDREADDKEAAEDKLADQE
eukprot:6827893-Prymnesium_polylepis.1